MIKNKINTDIILAFKNGDEQAFNEIYKHYSKRIYFFAYQHCYNKEIAKDIVQNTFVSAYRGISKLKSEEAFHRWILQIAFNELKTIMKKENMYTLHNDNVENFDEFFDFKQISTKETIESSEFFATISDTINSLSPKLRDIAVLKHFEELSNKEIAEVLNVSIGTVKSRTFRMNEVLREELTKQGMDPKTFQARSYTLPATFILALNCNPDIQGLSFNIVLEATKTIGASAGLFGFISSLALQSKILLSVATISIGFVVGAALYQNDDTKSNENLVQQLNAAQEEACKITSIIYNQEFTNESLKLTVQTLNDAYDAIHINGVETLYIEENGEYVVSLIRNKKVVDEQTLKITNIDKESPEIQSIDKVEDGYLIRLADNESGLNYDSLVFYHNGQVSNDFILDEVTGTIYFTYRPYSSNIFYIQDNAKNWREISIVSDQI